jgi:hypothetical protein
VVEGRAGDCLRTAAARLERPSAYVGEATRMVPLAAAQGPPEWE